VNYGFTVLTDHQVERIHQTGLQVLEQVGMKVYDDELCASLSRRGARVDLQQHLVRFPRQLVDAALAAAPRSFSMVDHNGNQILMQKGNFLPAVYSNAIKVWDWETKQVRPSGLDDLVRCVRLADAIPEIKVACPVCLPADLPQAAQMATAICTLLENSSKFTQAAPHDGTEAAFWTEAVAIADQDVPAGPTLMFAVSPTSPLQVDPNTCQVLKHGLECAVPLLISPCPMAGATSPVTMAGTAVQTHAEFLGMLTIAQVLRDGTPVIYGGSAGLMDLRIGALSYGAPERNTMLCANLDIANHFGLPGYASAGTVDSASPDFQAGQAKALAWLTRMMKGAALGIWFGSLLTGSAVAPEQIILDADVYRAILSMLKGMSLDEDRLAYEAICRVGPGGNFMADEHTLAWMRGDEYYASPLVNHAGEEGKAMLDRAHERVGAMLANHRPSVSEQVAVDLRVLLKDYTRHVSS
jgi:trimethylamine--corrinoid protein Co-methyltransferase